MPGPVTAEGGSRALELLTAAAVVVALSYRQQHLVESRGPSAEA